MHHQVAILALEPLRMGKVEDALSQLQHDDPSCAGHVTIAMATTVTFYRITLLFIATTRTIALLFLLLVP